MKGIIIDLSGVLINTTLLNKIAWEKVLNHFLKEHNARYLFNEEDYYSFIEGKPKYERLQNYLGKLNIELPYGNTTDSAGYHSICSLEKKKTKAFTQMLKKGEMDVYENAMQKIKLWKEKGIKTAGVSSDENFNKALESTETGNLFDVLIDAHASRKRGLKEKPEADLYLEAAKELDLPPESCILFDDTVQGLQAGNKGNFGLVVGVNRADNRKLLSENGADLVIDNFDEFNLSDDPEIAAWFEQPIPPFASEYVKIAKAVYEKTPVLFLDYDGTLTPIVQRPEAAVISEEMKVVLDECASKFKVAAVSGRDMDDLKSRINLENVIYAGSHGFRISGPEGLYMEHEKTDEILPRLGSMEQKLKEAFDNVTEGVQVERKRYAIAVHYRNAKPEDTPFIREKVLELTQNSEGFKVGEGKKILEIKPDIDWHKGKAVLWILDKLGLTDNTRYIPIYIGDDVTDEDAYRALKDRGIGIQVGPGAENTAAQFRLKNVYQVRLFLKELVNSIA